jgi:hypothetical protein
MKGETLSRIERNRALAARQMLLAREDVAVTSAVDRLVGLQAQQAQPPLIGLWTRLAGFERESLLRLLRDRLVVRGTLMRGTLPFMSSAEYLLLRSALQPALNAGMRSVLRERAGEIEISRPVRAAHRVFVERPRTFTELRAALMDEFPGGDERAMGYAARMHLPLVAVPEDSPWGFGSDPVSASAECWLGRSPDSVERTDVLIADEHRPKVTTRNLQVLPTFLVDGMVSGTWKTARARFEASLTIAPFVPLAKAAKDELAALGTELLRFIEPDAVKQTVRFQGPSGARSRSGG